VHSLTLLLYSCLYCFSFFCDSMWTFWVEANLCSFDPATFLYMSQAMTRISNVRCRGIFVPVARHGPDFQRHMSWMFFFVLREKVRGDCSFCWYWLNCWPSLFTLFFMISVTLYYYYLWLLINLFYSGWVFTFSLSTINIILKQL
jgi:hypothetical protein